MKKIVEEQIKFIDEWIEKFSEENISAYDLCDDSTFGRKFLEMGFNLDGGQGMMSKYGIDRYEKVPQILDKVTDTKALGDCILSYWRYFNHFAYCINEILAHKPWFKLTLTKLKELLTTP